MTRFERFKLALKKAEEKRFEELQDDVKKVRNVVEKILTMALENTAQATRTCYSGTEML